MIGFTSPSTSRKRQKTRPKARPSVREPVRYAGVAMCDHDCCDAVRVGHRLLAIEADATAEVVVSLQLPVPQRYSAVATRRPGHAHHQRVVRTEEVRRHRVRRVGGSERMVARRHRQRELVRAFARRTRADLPCPVVATTPSFGCERSARADESTPRRLVVRWQRAAAATSPSISSIDSPRLGAGGVAGATQVFPVVPHSDPRRVRRQRQPATITRGPPRISSNSPSSSTSKSESLSTPAVRVGIEPSRGPFLDSERHVDRTACVAAHAIDAVRVDDRVVIARVRVVAEHLAPRRDDLAEDRVRGVVLELRLEPGRHLMKDRRAAPRPRRPVSQCPTRHRRTGRRSRPTSRGVRRMPLGWTPCAHLTGIDTGRYTICNALQTPGSRRCPSATWSSLPTAMAAATSRTTGPTSRARWHDDFDAWAATYEIPYEDMKGPDGDRNWDSKRRLTELEADGIVAEVIFPNTVPPFFPKASLGDQPPAANAGDLEARWAGLAGAQPMAGRLLRRRARPSRRHRADHAARHPRCGRRDSLGQGQRPDRRRPASRRASRLRTAAAVRRELLRAVVVGLRRARPAGQPPQRQRRTRRRRERPRTRSSSSSR